MNEPTEVAEALPSGVMTATLMIDDDGDDETPDVEAENGYSITVSVPERDVPMTLFNLGDLVSDADSNDDLRFDVSGSPSHIVYDMATDNVLLTYLPPESDPGPRVDTIKVGVSDGVNGEDDDDLTLYIEISITEEQPEPITSELCGNNGCRELHRLHARRQQRAARSQARCRTQFPTASRAVLTVETLTT